MMELRTKYLIIGYTTAFGGFGLLFVAGGWEVALGVYCALIARNAFKFARDA